MKYPGSNWWSFDFHNHTPASSDYNPGERQQLTPRDWLLAYMRSGVDCVAITDHNSGDWIDRLKQELTVMAVEQPPIVDYREIHLFPGVELTSAEGIHVLAVYGTEEGAAKIHGLLALAQYNNDVNNAHGMCNISASAICDHIHHTGGVVILAHAEEINGLFHGAVNATGEFVPTRPDRSIEQLLGKVDAVEIHDENAPAIQHFANKLKGRAIVDGSDAHQTARAGVRQVWLKMAKPSIEGLKLALLDPESSLLRVADMPRAPLHRISSLRVEQLHLRRQPLDISFSPWFNAIIGGRGSGKSTLLEALRLAMARESDIRELGSAQESDVVRAFDRFRTPGGPRGNSGMVREETVLIATVEKFDPSANTNESYLFTWKPTGFHAQRKNEAGTWEDTGLSIEQAAKSFPVKVFSQKQIFELAERPSALLTYIDRASEVGLQDWQERNEELCRSLRDLRGKERGLLQAIEKKAGLETELREVSRKTLAYQQSNVAQQLQVFRENQQAQQVVRNFFENLSTPVQALEAALEAQSPFGQLRLEDIALQVPDPSALQQSAATIANELDSRYQVIRQTIAEMQQRIEVFQRSQPVVDYLQETDKAITAYREEVAKLRDQGIGTAQEAEAALKRKQDLETALAQIATQEAQLAVLRKQVVKTYAGLKFHRRRLTQLRRNFVNNVLVENPNLRITIDEQADVYQSSDKFRSLLRLQDGTFVEDVLAVDEATGQKTGLLGKLITDGVLDPTHKRVTNLKIGILERSREILGQVVNGRLVTAFGRLSADDDDSLLEWFPDDLVKVEFRRNRHDNFHSLERASAGQKTSSILSFLLSHGNEPLLLDQPEDDLDNALVSELVVEQIRNNKSRRQIVVVTHNPNIVVNGDAELVLPMDFVNGQIQQNDSGGLQERIVRQRICDIMEGGRDAFRQRYKRILEDLDATS
jgi:energy-coupling factor transporter ATP-binding protein EcfA2